MRTGRKLWIAAIVAVVMIFASWGVVFATVWSAGGLVTVSVDPGDGGGFTIAVPMAAIEGVVLAAHKVSDVDPGARLSAELGEWGPFVREVLDVLAEAPSATFVEVIDDETRVRVAKRSGKLVVDVEDYDVSVHVSMPMRPALRALQRLVA